jgi:hypothetical protein
MLAEVYVTNSTGRDIWVQSEVPGPYARPPVAVMIRPGEWATVYSIKPIDSR